MPEERIPAKDIAGIATNNIASYSTDNTDRSDDIVLKVPDGLACRARVVDTDAGRILYIEGNGNVIKGDGDLDLGGIKIGGGGGFKLQLGSVKGKVTGPAAKQMVAILVPPNRSIPKVNMDEDGNISEIG